MPALITHSLKDYADRAVELAEEKGKLARMKTTLRAANVESHLFNTERFVQYLEKAYVLVWQHYIDGKCPRMIDLRKKAE